MDKNYFQDIHYSRKKPNMWLYLALSVAEFFYSVVINFKNFLYDINLKKEKKVKPFVICIGNLTTGGVGKTPIVTEIANYMDRKTAIISRGYKAKLDNRKPNVIKDFNGLKYFDGTVCGDEPFEMAKNTNDNVMVITSIDRKKAAKLAIDEYGCKVIILDDGFSNRKIKKDKMFIAIDSKMRFGNNHLLPLGPLREPINQLKRADEIVLVDKGDNNFDEAIVWAKKLCEKYNLILNVARMFPNKIYSMNNNLVKEGDAIAFCAIGQAGQFFNFAKDFYNLKEKIAYPDHYDYKIEDIKNILKKADELGVKTLITTRKDEAKLIPLLKEFEGYSLNVLQVKVEVVEQD